MELYCIQDSRGIYHYYRSKDSFERGWARHARFGRWCKQQGFGEDVIATTISCRKQRPEWKEIRREK